MLSLKSKRVATAHFFFFFHQKLSLGVLWLLNVTPKLEILVATTKASCAKLMERKNQARLDHQIFFESKVSHVNQVNHTKKSVQTL